MRLFKVVYYVKGPQRKYKTLLRGAFDVVGSIWAQSMVVSQANAILSQIGVSIARAGYTIDLVDMWHAGHHIATGRSGVLELLPQAIRITATPPGFAPIEIREQWVGTTILLPTDRELAENRPQFSWIGQQNVGGFVVRVEDAIQGLLQKGREEAAEFWGTFIPTHLRFHPSVCELVGRAMYMSRFTVEYMPVDDSGCAIDSRAEGDDVEVISHSIDITADLTDPDLVTRTNMVIATANRHLEGISRSLAESKIRIGSATLWWPAPDNGSDQPIFVAQSPYGGSIALLE